MVDTYDVWLARQNETLNEDVGTALVALTTILVGIPVGTAVARTITKIIDTINELRNDRKFSEANTLAKKSLEKYKHLNKDNLQEGTVVYKSVAHAEAAAHRAMADSHSPEKHPKIHHVAMSRYHTTMAGLEKKRSGYHNSMASEHTALAAKHGVDVKKHRLQEEEASGEATSNLAGPTESSGPYPNHGKKEKRKTLEETVEETIEEIFEGVGLATSGMTRHKLTVHISEPNSSQHPPRKKPMIVVAAGHQAAIEQARKRMMAKGYKVHDVEHHGEVDG